jgi:flavin reductase (DIM6/NTAB) family NADH-FMN oxidoreductase RutF
VQFEFGMRKQVMADGGQMSHSDSFSEEFAPSGETTREFRTALGRFATGVTVITAQGPDGPVGITANSFASLSLDPPLVLWSPAKTASRFNAFVESRHYAIHVLAAEQADLCNHFARNGYDFDLPGLSANAQNVPLLSGCLARFECCQVAIHDGGDHVIIVGEVTHAAHRDGLPLTFSNGCLR